MPLNRPTKEELINQLQATLSGLDSSLVVTSDSDAGIKIRMLVEAIFGLHYEAGKIEDDLFVSDKTSTSALDKHADAKLEGGRKGATKASGTDNLTVTGTTGSTVLVNDELTSSDGVTYKVTAGVTLVAGTGVCSVESVDTGSQANRDVGETLTFTSPQSGITATATVLVALTNGEDAETDAELIVRLLDAYANPLGSGRLSDFRQWAMAVEGIVGAYSYGPTSNAQTGRRGIGIVDVAILQRGTGDDRIPSATTQQTVEDYIEARRPATTKEFSVLLPVARKVNLEIEITANDEYAWDWDRDAVLNVSSYTAATRTMILSDEIADVCPSGSELAAGDRVLISDHVGGWSEENTVKSVTDNTPVGQATVVFENDFTEGVPASGDEVDPAGPLTSTLLTALRAMYDALGPAKGDAYDPEQDAWESDVKVAKVYQTCMNVTGVGNADIYFIDNVGQGESDEASLDDGTDVELLVYGSIRLRPEGVPV